MLLLEIQSAKTLGIVVDIFEGHLLHPHIHVLHLPRAVAAAVVEPPQGQDRVLLHLDPVPTVDRVVVNELPRHHTLSM